MSVSVDSVYAFFPDIEKVASSRPLGKLTVSRCTFYTLYTMCNVHLLKCFELSLIFGFEQSSFDYGKKRV